MKVSYNITQNKFNASLNQETTEIKVSFKTGYYPFPSDLDISNLVPYTGATKDVNIASNYFKTSKGFNFTFDENNYFRSFHDGLYNQFEFNSNSSEFGDFKINANVEEGFVLQLNNDNVDINARLSGDFEYSIINKLNGLSNIFRVVDFETYSKQPYKTDSGFKKTGGTPNLSLTADGGTFDLNTKADLVDGKVPSSQLPSYVDDVLEFANLASFPATGESGKIYIALDTNITYRWSGTGYAEISASLALGETASTAYRGDRGKIAYDHSQTTGNPHSTTATDVDALKRDGSNANSNINIGEFQLKAGQIELDQTPTQPFGVGMIRWNDTDGTAEIRLKGNNVTLQLGQELVKRVVNKSGANLLESQYKVVKIVGATGQRLSIDLAQANNELNSATTLGMITENINNNQEGFITYSGEVNGINTTGSLQGETWEDGDVLYLSPSVAGGVTKVKPTAPNHVVVVGYVEYAHINQGKIFIKIDNGYELDEIHNVNTSLSKTNPVDADNLLIQDSADSSIWKKISWANIKATLKTYFDGLYAPKSLNVKVTTPSSWVTGTLAETEVLRIEIPANSLSASDVLRIPFLMINKVGTNGTIQIKGKLSTSPTMPIGNTDQLFQTAVLAAVNQYIAVDRQFIIEGGQIKGYPFTTGGTSGIGVNSNQITSKALDRAVTNYIYISLTLSNTNDQARFEGIQLNNS